MRLLLFDAADSFKSWVVRILRTFPAHFICRDQRPLIFGFIHVYKSRLRPIQQLFIHVYVYLIVFIIGQCRTSQFISILRRKRTLLRRAILQAHAIMHQFIFLNTIALAPKVVILFRTGSVIILCYAILRRIRFIISQRVCVDIIFLLNANCVLVLRPWIHQFLLRVAWALLAEFRSFPCYFIGCIYFNFLVAYKYGCRVFCIIHLHSEVLIKACK